MRDFRGTWANVCCEAGVGQFLCPECAQPIDFRRCAACSREWNRNDLKYVGLIFHDLRRTAARNLRNRGISEGVIMKIGGWRTRSVFDRYAIVSQGDIADAMRKLEAGQQREAKTAQEQADQFGQSLGRVTPESKNSRSSLPPYTPLSN